MCSSNSSSVYLFRPCLKHSNHHLHLWWRQQKQKIENSFCALLSHSYLKKLISSICQVCLINNNNDNSNNNIRFHPKKQSASLWTRKQSYSPNCDLLIKLFSSTLLLSFDKIHPSQNTHLFFLINYIIQNPMIYCKCKFEWFRKNKLFYEFQQRQFLKCSLSKQISIDSFLLQGKNFIWESLKVRSLFVS